MSNDYTIRAVERALRILDLFTETARPMTLKEISAYMDEPTPTVLRMLRTLQAREYVCLDEATKKYSLGYHAYMLGMYVDCVQEIRRICVPYMVELVKQIGLVCHLAIMVDNKAIIIEKVLPDGKSNYDLQSRVGLTVPVHCTSVGKVLASELDEDTIRARYTGKLDRYTSETITDMDQFLAILRQVRIDGYASTHNEHENFVRCIAYPVTNKQGKIVCAISLTGIDRELEGERTTICHRLLQSTARKLSDLFA